MLGGWLLVVAVGLAAGAQEPGYLGAAGGGALSGPYHAYSYPAAAHPVAPIANRQLKPVGGYGVPQLYGAGYGVPAQPQAPDCSADCAEADPWAQARCLRLCCGKSCGHKAACRSACFARFHLSNVEGPHEESPASPPPTPGPVKPQPQPSPVQPSYPTAKTLFKGYEYRSYRCAFTHNSNGALRCWTEKDGDFDCQVEATADKEAVTSCTRGESKLTCAEEHGVYWCSEYAEAGYYFALPGSPLGPRFLPRRPAAAPVGYPPQQPSHPSKAPSAYQPPAVLPSYPPKAPASPYASYPRIAYPATGRRFPQPRLPLRQRYPYPAGYAPAV